MANAQSHCYQACAKRKKYSLKFSFYDEDRDGDVLPFVLILLTDESFIVQKENINSSIPSFTVQSSVLYSC
jgi:hypothetical protein